MRKIGYVGRQFLISQTIILIVNYTHTPRNFLLFIFYQNQQDRMPRFAQIMPFGFTSKSYMFFCVFFIVCFTSYFMFSIAVLPHSPGVVYYHPLLRRETRIPGVAPFSFRIGIWDLFVHTPVKCFRHYCGEPPGSHWFWFQTDQRGQQ